MTKQKMTLEDLAQMVANGFRDVDERFEKVDKEFKSIHEEIDEFRIEVNTRFDRVESRLDRVETNHEVRLRKLEQVTKLVWLNENLRFSFNQIWL